jgi:chemotaxis methyl-accepting protein methylase
MNKRNTTRLPIWRIEGGDDKEWYSAVLAAYESMPDEERARIAHIAKDLETNLRDMGMKGALGLLAAIGIAAED